MYKHLSTFIIIALLFGTGSISAQVVINEVMPSNISVLYDEDGDTPDWIELYNPAVNSVSLENYFLSDNVDDLQKWQFPNVLVQPSGHLIIYASGKNRRNQSKHWETIIDWGDYWKYKLGTIEPPSGWKEIGFNDLGWSTGKTGIGYGDNDDSTTIVPVHSVYMRYSFTIDDITKINNAILHADYDDGFIAYLNGIEIARANMDNAGASPPYNQMPDNATEAQIYQGGLPQTFIVDSASTILQQGMNVLSIQVHNFGINSSDLTIIPFLTLGMTEVPVAANGINPILEGLFPNLHTNFNLSDDETLYFSNVGGEIIDSVLLSQIPIDISTGRYPDGSANWFYFDQPTPGSVNTPGYQGIAGSAAIFPEGNYFPSSVNISLSAEAGSQIYFSLDGSEPDQNSALYSSPITITSTSVIRCRTFKANSLPGPVTTKTIFINDASGMPIVSVSTNPENLWDADSGIYVLGNNAQSAYPYFGANFWEDWEKPAHVEFFEPAQPSSFSIDCGVKIFGGWSRGQPQKSLAFYMRGEYGSKTLDYKLFPDRDISSFKNFVLRNSGNDWNYSMYRDGMMQSLIRSLDIEKQAFRPAILFINGEFWGIQNIREKVNEDFIASYHNVDPNNIDLLENNANVLEGTNENYLDVINFIENSDLSQTQNYAHVAASFDLDNFIEYQLFNIYVDNRDWPGNNIKYWRERTEGAKWRWISFDTDFGFNIFDPWGHTRNTLEFALETNGPEWPNPPWSTFLLRKLLTNEKFKNNFINRFADLSNSLFTSEAVVSIIDSIYYLMNAEIQRHISRWNGFNYNSWNYQRNLMKTFAQNRIVSLRAFFVQKFQLAGTAYVNCSVSDETHGSIRINKFSPETYPWTGHYFQSVPIEIKAIPKSGYKFKEWTGDISSTQQTVTIQLLTSNIFTAVFEPDTLSDAVVINEINYNSAPEFDTEDWIELYNNSNENIEISNWKFKDSNDDNTYQFPAGLILNAGEYLVISKDTLKFKSFYPGLQNVTGGFDFSMSNGGELLRLYNSDDIIVDSLTYDDASPWPTAPDGSGSTLALLNPSLDNSLAENWSASNPYGTPGEINDVFTSAENEKLIAAEFELFQNYPNPFNPATTIKYSIPKDSRVRLLLYNVLGEQVDLLVEKEQRAGFYQVNFNAESLSSGVYFYVLQADDYIKTRKMIILK